MIVPPQTLPLQLQVAPRGQTAAHDAESQVAIELLLLLIEVTDDELVGVVTIDEALQLLLLDVLELLVTLDALELLVALDALELLVTLDALELLATLELGMPVLLGSVELLAVLDGPVLPLLRVDSLDSLLDRELRPVSDDLSDRELADDSDRVDPVDDSSCEELRDECCEESSEETVVRFVDPLVSGRVDVEAWSVVLPRCVALPVDPASRVVASGPPSTTS